MNKLQIARNIAEHLVTRDHMYHVHIKANFFAYSSLENEEDYDLEISSDSGTYHKEGITIDEVINHLQEIFHSKNHKYELNDVVWLVNSDNEIDCFKIDCIMIDCSPFEYSGSVGAKKAYLGIPEHLLYSSSEELIQAQIKKWTGLQ
jgi:hypothetical protein